MEIFSISVIRFLSPNSVSPLQSESQQTNTQGTTVSSSALWHIRKASYSRWESCDLKHRGNSLKSRQLKMFFLSSLNCLFLWFYSYSVQKHIQNKPMCIDSWRNGSASDSRSEGCVLKSSRGQLFAISYTKLLCLIARKFSTKRKQHVLRHWICCLMLSRPNSEHIFACANLLNISNPLFLTDFIISFICEWILPHEYRQLFLLQLWAHSQSVLLRMRKVVNCN